MSHANHVESLKAKHQSIDEKISDLQKHPSVDHLEIANLKAAKLRIKDAIEAEAGTVH